MEMEIQRLEKLDLERNGNPMGKLIHKLWKSWLVRKGRTGPAMIGTS